MFQSVANIVGIIVLLHLITFTYSFEDFSKSKKYNVVYNYRKNVRIKTNSTKIDAVIVTADKDTEVFEKAILSALTYLVDVDVFYIVTPRAAALKKRLQKYDDVYQNRVEFVDESIFPFNMENVADCMLDTIKEVGVYPLGAGNGHSQFEKIMYQKLGWYYQQLLKLYAGRVLDLKDYVLLDSDIIWFKPVPFIAKINDTSNVTTYYYGSSRQYTPAYIASLKRISGIPYYVESSEGQIKNHHRSGIVHHIVLSKHVLDHLWDAAVSLHDNLPFWQVVMNETAKEATCVAPNVKVCNSGNVLSEYELYFNYARVKFSETVALRALFWTNGPSPGLLFWPEGPELRSDGGIGTWHRVVDGFKRQVQADQLQGYDYVGYHGYAKRRYTELQWNDLDELCERAPLPYPNSTCSWRGFEQLKALNRVEVSQAEYFKNCNCYMAMNQHNS